METIKNSLVRKGTTPREEKPTMLKRIRARICHNCPVCNHARKNPESRIGIFHNRYHADNCPCWKDEKEVYGERNARNISEMNSLMMWKAF